jgi:hypothetical protein
MTDDRKPLKRTRRTPLATMTANTTTYLAGALERTSDNDRASCTPPENSPPHEPTLLGIPQELRNKILGHVYDVSDTPGGGIGLMLDEAGWCCPYGLPEAGIQSSEAPPSKNPILVCRQLYKEMRSMQAAAFRQYWSKSTFDASVSCHLEETSDRLYRAADRDLQHIKCFSISCGREGLGFAVDVECRFQAGRWTASFSFTDHVWMCICDCNGLRRRVSRPRGLLRLVFFDREMRRQASGDEPTTMDPDLGAGFTARDMRVARRVVVSLILRSPSSAWAPL